MVRDGFEPLLESNWRRLGEMQVDRDVNFRRYGPPQAKIGTAIVDRWPPSGATGSIRHLR